MSEEKTEKTQIKSTKKHEIILSPRGDEIYKIKNNSDITSVVHWMSLDENDLCRKLKIFLKIKEKKDCTKEAKLYCFVCKKKFCQKCATLLHSKKNFHVKYCTSVEEFKKFGNASIYCETIRKIFLNTFTNKLVNYFVPIVIFNWRIVN
jgi:hypothetical protein